MPNDPILIGSRHEGASEQLVNDLPVIRRQMVPLGTTIILEQRAVLINPAGSPPNGQRIGGWSRYTVGQRELERDRRLYPRTNRFIITVQDSMLNQIPPPPGSVYDMSDAIRPPALVGSNHDLMRNVQAWVKKLLGETVASAVLPELEPGPYPMPHWRKYDQVCRVYWGSHGCALPRGHDGPHLCRCAWEDPRDSVGAPPYYGPETHFYGEDVGY
jgi:hypothetical protein